MILVPNERLIIVLILFNLSTLIRITVSGIKVRLILVHNVHRLTSFFILHSYK